MGSIPKSGMLNNTGWIAIEILYYSSKGNKQLYYHPLSYTYCQDPGACPGKPANGDVRTMGLFGSGAIGAWITIFVPA